MSLDEKFKAVHRLIKQGDLISIRDLLEHHLDPNLPNKFGWTLLMLAALHGRGDIAQLLIVHGADKSRRNKFGQSAAELAEAKGHHTLAAALTVD